MDDIPKVCFGDTEAAAADDETSCGYHKSSLLVNAFQGLQASEGSDGNSISKDETFDKIINCYSQEEAFRLAYAMNRRQHPLMHGSCFNSHDVRPEMIAYCPFHYHPFGIYVKIQKKWCNKTDRKCPKISAFKVVNMHLNFRVDQPKGEDEIALHNNRNDFGEAAAWATLAVTRHDQCRTLLQEEKEKRMKQLQKEGHTDSEAEMIYVTEGLEYVKEYVKKNERLIRSFHE